MRTTTTFTLLLLSFIVSGCEFIGDVFGAGVYTGVFLVIVVIVLILFLVFRMRRRD